MTYTQAHTHTERSVFNVKTLSWGVENNFMFGRFFSTFITKHKQSNVSCEEGEGLGTTRCADIIQGPASGWLAANTHY